VTRAVDCCLFPTEDRVDPRPVGQVILGRVLCPTTAIVHCLYHFIFVIICYENENRAKPVNLQDKHCCIKYWRVLERKVDSHCFCI